MKILHFALLALLLLLIACTPAPTPTPLPTTTLAPTATATATETPLPTATVTATHVPPTATMPPSRMPYTPTRAPEPTKPPTPTDVPKPTSEPLAPFLDGIDTYQGRCVIADVTPAVSRARAANFWRKDALGFMMNASIINFFTDKRSYEKFITDAKGKDERANWYSFRVVVPFSETTTRDILFYDGSVGAKSVPTTRIVLETVNALGQPVIVEIDAQNSANGPHPTLKTNIGPMGGTVYPIGNTAVGAFVSGETIAARFTGRMKEIDNAPANSRVHLGWVGGSDWLKFCEQ